MPVVTISECGKGVNKDLLASELAPGVWSDSLNMQFTNGFARNRKGLVQVYAPKMGAGDEGVALTLFLFNGPLNRYLIECGADYITVDDGTTATGITGDTLTGGPDDRPTGGDLNGVMVFNNGVDVPSYWDNEPAHPVLPLPAWPSGHMADTLRPFKNYLFAGSVTVSGVKNSRLLMWSSATEPGSVPSAWAAAATNDAGDDPLSGMGGIVDFLPLGDVNVIYCEEGYALAQFVGGNDVFRIVPVPGRNGLRARGCAVQTPKGHVFMSNGDVLLHNGSEAASIAEGRIRNWINTTIDPTYANRSFLVTNPQESEVWVCFPSSGSQWPDTVAVWNWSGDTWGIFSMPSLSAAASGLVSSGLLGAAWEDDPNSWESDITSWTQDEANSNEARVVVCSYSSPDTVFGLANTGSQDFDESIAWRLEKDGIVLNGADQMKVVSRCRPHLQATAGTQIGVQLSTTQNANDTPAFNNTSSFTQGTSNWANQFTKAGRYAAVVLEGMDGQQVAIRSYELEVTDSKARF